MIRSIVAFIFVSLVLYPSVEAQDPAQLQAVANQYGAGVQSTSKLNDLLGQYNAKKKQQSDTLLGMRIDTTTKRTPAKTETTRELSSYEHILRGDTLDPDRMIGGLRVFGLDVFARASGSAVVDNASVTPDYVIQPGDEVVLALWGRINEQNTLTVSREGTIAIPRIGPVAVAGIPFEAMQKKIMTLMGTVEGVQISVSMGRLRSIGIYVLGEVQSPGYYTLSAFSNVSTALFAAGGPTARGSLRTIAVKRGNSTLAKIDFYDFLLSGQESGKLRLSSGDVIFVPIVQSMVAVAGNVRRAAIYETTPATTLDNVLLLAGGLTPAAWVNRIQIERFEQHSFQRILDIVVSNNDKVPPLKLADGDIVKIFPVLDKDTNVVFLIGNVQRPGKYEYKPGLRVGELIGGVRNLKPETYFDYAVVRRPTPPSFLSSIIPFNVTEVLADSTSASNIFLQPRDEVVIYNRDFFEPERGVVIDGAVTKPGKYKMLNNMRVKDLILEAGGLTEDASPTRGELYRRAQENATTDMQKLAFCVKCALADDTVANLLLQKQDNVFIRKKEGWEETKKITLEGEFNFPGEYILLPNESLDQLIERAGGFSNNAYLSAALLTRPTVKLLEQKRSADYTNQLEGDLLRVITTMAAKENSASAQTILEQNMQLIARLRANESAGRVIIDLTDEKSYTNFKLEQGDILFVPKNTNTVSVLGEVFNPATFRYIDNRSNLKVYVEQAGGFKATADKANTYVIRPNGTVISAKMTNINKITLGPGDVIIVPQKIDIKSSYKAFVSVLDFLSKISGVAVGVIGIWLATKEK